MRRVTRTGISQSEAAFRILLEGNVNPSGLANQDFFKRITDFLHALDRIYQANLYASDREDPLYFTDGWVANAIATAAIKAGGPFSNAEITCLSAWLTDKRFRFFIAHLMYWQQGNALTISNGVLAQLTGTGAGAIFALDAHVVRLAKSLCEMLCTDYCEQGHTACDVLGVISNQKQNKRLRFNNYQKFQRTRFLIGQFYKLLASDYHKKLAEGGSERFNKPLSQYTVDDLDALLAAEPKDKFAPKFSRHEKSQIKKLFENNKKYICDCQEVMSTFAYECLQDIQVGVATTIHSIVDMAETTFISDDPPLPSWRGRPFFSFVYDYFFKDGTEYRTVLQDYKLPQLVEYFKLLLATLYTLTYQDIPQQSMDAINDTFCGTRETILKGLYKQISGSKIKDLYFTLLALVSNCSTITECAEKLATKFLEHNQLVQALYATKPQQYATKPQQEEYKKESEYYAESGQFLAREEQLRRDFFNSHTSEQLLSNAKTYEAWVNFHEQIRKYNKIYQNQIKEDPDLTNQQTYWQAYLEQEKNLINLYDNQSHELRRRLYEEEVALLEYRYAESVKGDPILAMLLADNLQKSINEARARFDFHLFKNPAVSGSSLIHMRPDVKYEFNVVQATTLTVIQYCDTVNQRNIKLVGHRNDCLRQESDYHGHALVAAKLQGHGNKDQIKYKKILARYDSDLHAELLRNKRAAHQQRLKILRYVGFGVLGVAGAAAVAAASVATLGLIHIVWLIPIAFYAAGGTGIAIGLIGSVLNDELRRHNIATFFTNIKKSIKNACSGAPDPIRPSNTLRQRHQRARVNNPIFTMQASAHAAVAAQSELSSEAVEPPAAVGINAVTQPVRPRSAAPQRSDSTLQAMHLTTQQSARPQSTPPSLLFRRHAEIAETLVVNPVAVEDDGNTLVDGEPTLVF